MSEHPPPPVIFVSPQRCPKHCGITVMDADPGDDDICPECGLGWTRYERAAPRRDPRKQLNPAVTKSALEAHK